MIKAIIIGLIFQFQSPSDTIQLVDSNDILLQIEGSMEEENYMKSIELIKLINEADSNYISAQITLIKAYSKNLQFEEAVKLGSNLMKEQKNLPSNFYITLGNELLNSGTPDEAIKIYQEGLKHFPYYHPLIYNIGFSKYKKEEYDEALGYFQQVLTLSPFYSSAHQMVANIMAMTNQRTKAILAYMTYLAINPNENWALIRINDLVNDAYRKEGSISTLIDNKAFEYYDNLLKSKAALDERYDSQVNFEAPAAQQCELLLKKLKYKEGTDDFWMNFYVPYLSQLSEQNLTQAFIYFMLTSAKNEDVNKWLDKHQKEKDQLISTASDYLSSNKITNARTLNNNTTTYTHWYHNNNLIQAIGAENEGLDIGPYEYYHSNGRLQARGVLSKQGNKTGDWYYYHDNGQLKSIQSHNSEGQLEGKIISYQASGKTESVAEYKNGELNGFWEWYYPCGNLKEQYPYINGVGTGKGKLFYNTGELNVEYNIKDDVMHGSYVIYHKSGDIKSSFHYKEGLISGDYTSYHANSEKNETGSYEKGKLIGIWKTHFKNGGLSNEGELKDGKRIGTWDYYFPNGNISYTEQYDQDSLLHGLTTWYDEDGILYCKRNYNKDTLVSYSYFSKKGQLIHQEENSKGNMKYLHYYASGQLNGRGTLVNGKTNGEYTTYHLNGNIHQDGIMKNNDWDGEYKEYDESEVLIQHCTFNSGTLNGYYRGFHLNGSIKEEGWIKDGNIQQTWNEYFPNGSLAYEMYYTSDELNGISKTYGPQGKLFSEELYDDGLLIGFKQYDTLGIVYNEVAIPNSSGKALRKSPSGQVYSSKSINCGENVNDITYYHPSGKILSQYEMNNSQIESYKKHNLNGVLIAEGNYENEKKSGPWDYYYDNGVLSNRYIYKNGNLEGVSKRYYENGAKKHESNYFQDERHGATTYYAPNGDLQLIKYYKQDLGSYAYQYQLPNGMISDSVYLEFSKDKELKSYFKNGKLSVIQQFQKNYYHGDVIFYTNNGQIITKSSYQNGNRHGKTIRYDYNGNLKQETNYLLDEKHGQEIEYYPNGKVKLQTSWLHGKQNGWFKSFHENGSLSSETYYWNDFQY